MDAAEAFLIRRRWAVTIVAILCSVAAVAAISAASVHTSCYHSPPPISPPEVGTARAVYCDRIESWHLRLFLIGAPMLIACLLLLVSRRRAKWAWVLTAVLLTATIANAVVAHNLTSATTF